MEKLYLITIHWGTAPNTTKIESALQPLGTWLRFSQHSWLFWSLRTSQEIYNALAPILTREDFELILRVDENDWYGFAQPWVWNWIRSKGATLDK
jgi:hypothetical protein